MSAGSEREWGEAPRPPGYRPVHVTGGPRISLVVLSSGDARGLRRCLRELLPGCARRDVEVVVVCAAGRPPKWAEATYPGVRLVSARSGTDAQRRALGLAAAQGDIVVFASEREAGAPGWLDARMAGWTAPAAQALVPPDARLTGSLPGSGTSRRTDSGRPTAHTDR